MRQAACCCNGIRTVTRAHRYRGFRQVLPAFLAAGTPPRSAARAAATAAPRASPASSSAAAQLYTQAPAVDHPGRRRNRCAVCQRARRHAALQRRPVTAARRNAKPCRTSGDAVPRTAGRQRAVAGYIPSSARGRHRRRRCRTLVVLCCPVMVVGHVGVVAVVAPMVSLLLVLLRRLRVLYGRRDAIRARAGIAAPATTRCLRGRVPNAARPRQSFGRTLATVRHAVLHVRVCTVRRMATGIWLRILWVLLRRRRMLPIVGGRRWARVAVVRVGTVVACCFMVHRRVRRRVGL